MFLKRSPRSRLLIIPTLVAALATFAAGPAYAPQVTKLEPPQWWVGLPSSPMLLLTGRSLEGAAVSVNHPGVRVARTEARPGGAYVFVWLDISPDARPGTVPITVTTAAGKTEINFPLLPRGDPRGKFQGLSPDDVIYLIMPDRFDDGDPANDEPAPELRTYDRTKPKAWHGGDLKGIRDRLPYLKQLGVTALWLTPFWKNDWRADDYSYHGYHVVDFYAVDEHFGTLRDLQELVAQAHEQGIKLIIDYVVNHTGPHHPWAAAPPTSTWLHGTPQNHLSPAYEFGPLVDPHAVPRQARNVLEGWFAGKLPDLNPDDPLLAQYLEINAEWWLETTGADAFRLDTFPYSPRDFWGKWHADLFRAYPHLTTVGEVWNPDPFITSFFAGGRAQFDGIDTRVSTVFDFPLFYAIREVLLRGASARKLVDVLEHDSLYPRPDALVTFFGNHDTRRFMSEAGATKQKLKNAFTLLLTLRGIPEIYSGDEIGMPGGDDPDNRRDFPGGFAGDVRNAFTASGRTPDEQEIFTHVQALLRLRREHPALRGGRLWHIGMDDQYYAFLRERGADRLLVVFNNSDTPRNLTLPLGDTPLAEAQQVKPLFGGGPASVHDQVLGVQLAASSVAIYEVQ